MRRRDPRSSQPSISPRAALVTRGEGRAHPIRPLIVVILTTLLALPSLAGAEGPFVGSRSIFAPGAVLPHRERPAVVNRMLRQRLDELLPRLMRETGIDCWLVINREYVEDPVYFTLVPAPTLAARRTTMLIFFDRGAEAGVERLTVNRYPLADLYDAAWEGGDLDEQWRRLGQLLAEHNPARIGINTSRHWPLADGLTAALHDRLLEVLTPELRQRLVSAEQLVVRWLETRTREELEIYPHIVALARGIIAEAFSERVVTPGVTTTEDVAWYLRQRCAELGLRIWFMPHVDRQSPETACDGDQPSCGEGGIIRRGDLLHTDVGICYLRLCTDTQEMGYVLRLGEDEVPAPLRRALALGNRWQDLLTIAFVSGRTGNQILAAVQRATEAEAIVASTYTHALGFHGHAAGLGVGMWDHQGSIPILGDWPLRPGTAYAIEGNVKVPRAEVGWPAGGEASGRQWIQIKLEQSASFDGKSLVYLAGRQTRWHVVR